jgi:hypothetical protein
LSGVLEGGLGSACPGGREMADRVGAGWLGRLELDLGSDPHFVMVTAPSWSGGEEDSVAEQVETGVAVHLPLEDLEPVDVAFGCS